VSVLLVGAISPFGSAVATLVVTIALVILLSLRAWIGVSGFAYSKRDFHWLTATIVVLLIMFLILVNYRFQTFG
jgi:hypothetical protein